MESVMSLNEKAIKPDVIFYLYASDEVCFARIKHRNKAQELFEKNLSDNRKKYTKAIEMIKKHRNENVIEINADRPVNDIVKEMMSYLMKSWIFEQRFG